MDLANDIFPTRLYGLDGFSEIVLFFLLVQSRAHTNQVDFFLKYFMYENNLNIVQNAESCQPTWIVLMLNFSVRCLYRMKISRLMM